MSILMQQRSPLDFKTTLTENLILETDSYKLGHDEMYMPNTNKVYSYFESREGAQFDKTVFFGLQYIIKRFLLNAKIPDLDITKALINSHIGEGAYNSKWGDLLVGQDRIKLPVSIRAVPEGTPVETGNVLMTVENIDPSGKYRFLTNYIESLLTHVWYPSTVATKSYALKQMIAKYLRETCDNPDDFLPFMLHDFGYRGTETSESSAIGGMAHLVNFMGTDTVPALGNAMYYYGLNDVPAYSVYATEHSIMTQLGKEGEMEVLEMLLRNEKYKKGILSIVIDSYDWRNFLIQAGTRFKDLILDREGQVVFRPDSGDPVEVSCEAWDILNENFGSSVNSKDYRFLNPKVRLLWGDGIDMDGVEAILQAFKAKKVSAQDILFGMGGALLQKVNRDMQRFAFKSSYQERDGVGFDICKDPIDGSKSSKPGQLALVKTETGYKTVPLYRGWYDRNELVEVFRNGELLVDQNFNEIRARAV